MQATADRVASDRTKAASPLASSLPRGATGGLSRARPMRRLPYNGPRPRWGRPPEGHAPCDRTRSGALPRAQMASATVPERSMRRLRVVFERDESGTWIVRVPQVRGCHSYGRTLDQARMRIREALRLFDVDRVDLAEDIRLPARLLDAVRRARRARERSAAQRSAAQAELRAATSTLTRAGLSRRDAGSLLGLSRQRIQQLDGA